VLACGSTFDVLEDRPVRCVAFFTQRWRLCFTYCAFISAQNGVQVLLQSSDPHSTARQIGLRLQARYGPCLACCVVMRRSAHVISFDAAAG
jgi:hypothetical protein